MNTMNIEEFLATGRLSKNNGITTYYFEQGSIVVPSDPRKPFVVLTHFPDALRVEQFPTLDEAIDYAAIEFMKIRMHLK